MSLERQTVLTAQLDEVRSLERIVGARVRLSPGGRTARHFHPCPVGGIVLAGAVRLQLAGREPITLRPGDVFYEPANAAVAEFDNVSVTEAATFVAWYLLPPGETRLIEILGPGDEPDER
jgi:quercetin dioxygenase-like cupin family protein